MIGRITEPDTGYSEIFRTGRKIYQARALFQKSRTGRALAPAFPYSGAALAVGHVPERALDMAHARNNMIVEKTRQAYGEYGTASSRLVFRPRAGSLTRSAE